MTADITTARQTVDTVSNLIARIVDHLVSQGAQRDRAVEVATDHVLTTMAAERPAAFGAYTRSLAVLETAAARPPRTENGMTTATNPDGTYTAEFLLWEARLAARVAGRDVIAAARHLRRVLGVPTSAATPVVLGLADLRAATNPAVDAARTAHTTACEAYFGAMVNLADLDPSVDIRPLLPA